MAVYRGAGAVASSSKPMKGTPAVPHSSSAPQRRAGAVLLALFAALTLLLGACSTSGDDASDDPTTTTAADGADPDTTSTTGGDDDSSSTTADDDTSTTTEDDGSDPAGGVVVEEIADGLEEGLQIADRDTAVCIATGWVDVVTEDRILESGADPGTLGDGRSEEWSMLDVSESEAEDLYDAVGDCDHDIVKTFLDMIAGQGDFTDEQVACFTDLIDESVTKESLVQTFLGQSGETETELDRVYDECRPTTD